MGKKVAFGTIAGFVALFILGFVVYGLLLRDTMAKAYEGAGTCVNMEPSMVHIVLATLVQALVLSLILYKFNVNTLTSGLIAAGWVTLLVAVMYAIWYMASFPWYTTTALIMDLVSGTVIAALAGGAIGFVYGKVK